jgi:hypothetical protein
MLAALAAPPVSGATSTWIWREGDGLLDYRTQADGDRIPDFSMVGYGAGWTDLPTTPPVVVTVTATTGDTTSRIQAAINSAAAMPLQANGYRGTVQLGPGDYEIAGQLKITASGIVLRGAGRDLASGSASRLIATGTSTRDVISIGSTSPQPNHSGFSKIAIADARVPVGATSFAVASTTGLSVGHTINVNWTSNQAWIDANGMNLLTNPWQPGDRQQNSDRVIGGSRAGPAVAGARGGVPGLCLPLGVWPLTTPRRVAAARTITSPGRDPGRELGWFRRGCAAAEIPQTTQSPRSPPSRHRFACR